MANDSISYHCCTMGNGTSNRILFLLAFEGCSVATAELGPSKVLSARLENVTAVPDRASIHVNIRNTGERPITAFSLDFYVLNPKGERIPCGGRGADMIDWSDPMPGRGIYVHMRRNWIPPNGTLLFDGYPRCPGVEAPLESIQVELNNVMFDDGTGEGDSRRMEFTLFTRQQERNERLKWIGRFTALRDSSDLKSSAQSLYQDLVDAPRSAEINPDDPAPHPMPHPLPSHLPPLPLHLHQS